MKWTRQFLQNVLRCVSGSREMVQVVLKNLRSGCLNHCFYILHVCSDCSFVNKLKLISDQKLTAGDVIPPAGFILSSAEPTQHLHIKEVLLTRFSDEELQRQTVLQIKPETNRIRINIRSCRNTPRPHCSLSGSEHADGSGTPLCVLQSPVQFPEKNLCRKFNKTFLIS